MNSEYLRKRNGEIARLYADGDLTLREIGERFNLSHERVRQILERAGVKRRRRQLTQRNQEIARLYVEEGLPLGEVAARFRLSGRRVGQILEEAGVHRHSLGWPRWPREHVWERMHEIVRLYAEEGLTLEEIAPTFRLGHARVRQILKSAGVSRRRRGRRLGWRSRDLTGRNQKITSAYVEDGLSLREIEVCFGLSRDCVRRILQEAGVYRGPAARRRLL